MKKNELENIFKSKLSDHETPFDIEKGWSKLEPRISNKRRRRILLIFLTFGMISLASVLTYNYISVGHIEVENTIEQHEIEESAENRLLQLIEEVEEIEKAEAQSLDKEVNKSKRKEDKRSNHRAFLDTDTDDINIGSTDSDNSKGYIHSVDDLFLNQDFNVKSSPLDGRSVAPSLTKDISPLLSTSEPNRSVQFTYLNSVGLNLFQIEKPSLKLPLFASLSVEESQVIWSKWSLSIQGGMGLYESDFKFSDGGDSGLKTEKVFLHELESFVFSGKVNYGLSNRLSFNTGIEYFQSNEKFDYSHSSLTSRVIEGTQKIIYNPQNGVSTYVIGPVNQVGNEWIEVVNFNKHVNWNIPFGLSYRMGHSSLQFNPGAGFVLNVSHQKTGKELLQSEVVSSDHSDLSKNNVGVALYFEPQITYKVNRSTNLLLSPGIRKSMSNWSKQENVTQKPVNYYFFLGLERKL